MNELVAVLAAAALFAGFGLLRFLVGPEGIGMCGCGTEARNSCTTCPTGDQDPEVRHD